jgi:ABC-type glucose/galactose transport system permease subunit
MYEISIIIAIILAILIRIFLKEHVEFKLPEIIKFEDGTKVLKLNILFTVSIGLISGFILFYTNPESFTSPVAAFLSTYGANGFVESVGTKFLENEENTNGDEEE